MSFNFGAQPFKHTPETGYVAVCEAPKDNVKQNETGTVGGGSSQSKPMKNAPQAIIIEVNMAIMDSKQSLCFQLILIKYITAN